MSKLIELETERLYLRQWRAGDLEPFSSMNADEKVMQFYQFSRNTPPIA